MFSPINGQASFGQSQINRFAGTAPFAPHFGAAAKDKDGDKAKGGKPEGADDGDVVEIKAPRRTAAKKAAAGSGTGSDVSTPEGDTPAAKAPPKKAAAKKTAAVSAPAPADADGDDKASTGTAKAPAAKAGAKADGPDAADKTDKTKAAEAADDVDAPDADAPPKEPPPVDPAVVSHNLKLGKAMLFSSAIPLATCFLYTLGFWPGALIGAPIAYLSGMYGRRLRKDINDEQIHKALGACDAFAEKLKKGPENLQPGDFSALFNSVAGNAADLRVTKIGAMLMPLLQNKLVRQVLEKMGLTRLFSGLKNMKGAAWVGERVGVIKALDQHGAKAAAEHGVAGVMMKGLLKGMSINMRVANEDNPLRAVGAGLWGLVSFIAWPVFLGWGIVKSVVGLGGKKDGQQPT